jgi:hypothetical protein
LALTTSAQFSADGVYLLRLTADDSELTGSDEVTITVAPIPDVTAPTVTLTAPGVGLVSGAVTVAAIADDNAGVAGVEFRVGSTVIGTDTTTPYSLSWDSTTVANGAYTITAQATDTSANTATDSVTVTVDNGAPVNQAPTVNAGTDQQITLPTNSVTLFGTASDDGLPSATLTTSWSVVSGPGNVTFGDSLALTTSAQFSADGVYVLQLTADDSALSNTDNITVTVQATPVLTNIVLSPTQVQLAFGANQQFTATGQDQYGGVIATNTVWTATGGSIDQSGLYLAGSIAGQYTVTATDGAISVEATVDITDSAPRQAYLGFNSDYVEIADSDDLDLSGSAFTVSAWINPTDWGQNYQGRILDHGGGSSGNAGWSLHLENKPSKGSPQALRVQINNASTFNGQSAPAAIQLGVWQHVAITHDGDTLTIFVNGVQVGQTNGVPIPSPSNAPIRIGARATDQARFFNGAIDEVRIWTIALTPQEIAAQMNTELTGTEPSLVAYYKFNEGAGQTANDGTPNAHNGQLGATAVIDSTDPIWLP